MSACFAVFDLQKLFCNTVPQEFFSDVVIGGKTSVCHGLVAREQKFLERTVSHAEIERPRGIHLSYLIDHAPDCVS